MADVQIAVFLTQEAENHDSSMKSKFENYAEYTFGNTPHSVHIEKRSHNPDPPSEEVFDQQDGNFGCASQDTYSTLWPWWQDYHQCKGLYRADDSNLLITNSTGLGGRGGVHGFFAAADGAQIANLSTSVDSQGCTDGHEAMQVALHEVGHNLGLRHNDGWAYKDPLSNDQYYTTHMMSGYADSYDENTCKDNIETDTFRCMDQNYSDCADDQIEI